MTRFWWVRHGPTHEKTFVGWRDVPADLTDHPRLARLSAHLPTGARLVSSDLARASATADAIATGRCRLPHDPALREFNFGDWDGKHFAQVAESHPSLSRQYWEDPGDHAPPGGESWNTVAARVNAAVEGLLSPAPTPGPAPADIIIVAHIGVILTQVQRALGVTAHQALAHRIDNLSVTQLVHDAGRWRAAIINHQP
jgi:broad specificity phosphatase PhoE